jgi:hypothetical protein
MPAVRCNTPFPTQAKSCQDFVATPRSDVVEQGNNDTEQWHVVERRNRRHRSPYQRPKEEGTVSFKGAKKLAAEMDVTAILDYIPMVERWGCYWKHPDGKTILVDPKRGELEWCRTRAERPGNDGQMQRGKLYICSGLVGPTVRQVVGEMMWRRDGWKAVEKLRRRMRKEKKRMDRIQEWEKVDQWITEEVAERMVEEVRGGWAAEGLEEWKAEVPKGYHQFLETLDDDEIAEAMTTGCASKQEWKEWLDQKVTERAEQLLEEDMKRVEMEKKVLGHELWWMQERVEWAEEAARNMV